MTRISIRLAGTAALVACGLLLSACGNEVSGPAVPLPERQETQSSGMIALLLPYGDESRKDLMALAESLENSARLAVRDSPTGTIDLRIYSTSGTAEGAASAAQTALADGASVILGPVFRDAATSAAAVAAAQRVPVLSFSNDSSIVGNNLFILGHTFENSADRIVQFAAANGRRDMLSIYARNEQGMKGNSAIEASIGDYDAELAGSLSYEFSQIGVVDSVPQVKELVETTDADIIVFTADTAGALSLLGTLLPEAGIDIEQVQFAGLTRWDIPESNLRNKGLQGGWFPLPDPNLSTSFSYRYRYEFDQVPHPLAGLAYDGIIAARSMLSSNSAHANVAALRAPGGFIGATGPYRFLADGHIERALAVAEIRNFRAEIISPAPRQFAGESPS
ncbi:MAG: penicillin-binding protein activator [Rhodobacteraceae bacterium]|nr:penicillin-binding protein activator [Paracoccaceae bacterium]MCY4197877.1 penicillin-binding protein activator [Paracoccaceae bacterium]